MCAILKEGLKLRYNFCKSGTTSSVDCVKVPPLPPRKSAPYTQVDSESGKMHDESNGDEQTSTKKYIDDTSEEQGDAVKSQSDGAPSDTAAMPMDEVATLDDTASSDKACSTPSLTDLS